MPGRPKFRSLSEAFWHYVQKQDGCWNWPLSVGSHGYGQLTFLQQKYTTHRVSWELHFGSIPDELCVLHKCDNRRCCNPNHLFLGTKPENLEDMTRKGRRVRGETHGMNILSESQVREILASPELHRVLAERYGVGKGTIHAIKCRKIWKHLELQ